MCCMSILHVRMSQFTTYNLTFSFTNVFASSQVMSFWPCTALGCTNKSLFAYGDCRYCSARLCGIHVNRVEYHPCVGLDDDAQLALWHKENDKMVG